MNTMEAFARCEASRNKPKMVFDWDKAARLIKENQPKEAAAGLKNDWVWTGGVIYCDGKPITDSYTYLASTHAIPELIMDGVYCDCYLSMNETEWDSETKWPQTALDILEG